MEAGGGNGPWNLHINLAEGGKKLFTTCFSVLITEDLTLSRVPSGAAELGAARCAQRSELR